MLSRVNRLPLVSKSLEDCWVSVPRRDDSSGLSYYGARYLAPWLTRWISPDSAGTVDCLNLYVYVGNNPLKYSDPTGHFPLISWGRFVKTVNAYKKNQRDLNIWVGGR
jgi:RHS repeat-associated protein